MQSITLQIADNGIIKTVKDDNINGAGEEFESTVVYEFNTNQNKIEFIKDLCVEIGLEFGNSRSENQIQVIENWGDDFEPTPEQAKQRIEVMQSEIKRLSQDKDG